MYFGIHVIETFGEQESLSKFAVVADDADEARRLAIGVLRGWQVDAEEVSPGYFEYLHGTCAARFWTVEPLVSFGDAIRFIGVLSAGSAAHHAELLAADE